MEAFLVLLGLATVALVLVLPIWALVWSIGARREVRRLRSELQAVRAELRSRAPVEAPMREVPATPPASDAAPADVAPAPDAEGTPPAPDAEATPTAPEAEATPPAPDAEAPPPSTPEAAATPPAPDAVPAPEAPSAPPPKPQPQPASLEEQIALVWFTRIGAVALLLGVAYFFKYAVDNEWIGPLGRVALGAVAGTAVLAFAELTRARTRPAWTQVTLGVGLAFLLLSAYASHAFYHLVPVTAAFGAFFVVSLLGGALAMHHRAESILILALAAALAAPVLLSTGEDRPAALFGYLLLVTALSHAASVRMQFRWSLWLGIAGCAALFLGWYARFFDASPAPTFPVEDVPLAELEGAYLHLASRAVPLAAVTAFLFEWLVVWRAAREKARLWPIAILVAAALLAHVGFAALLFDHPLHLGGVLTVIAVLSAVLLHREGRSELLALPLLASFAVLVATVHAAARTQPVAMLALLGLWAAIYVAGFLRGRLAGAREATPRTLGLLGGVGVGFAVLSAVLLGRAHPLAFGGVLVALSLPYGLLAVGARAPRVLVGAIVVTFCFLVAHSPRTGAPDLPFVAVAAAWAAVYLAAVAWELFKKEAKPTAGRLLVFSAAGLAFAFFATAHTGDDQGPLRAALLGAVGVIDLLAGARLLARAPETRRPATVLLGQALGLFAAAAGLLFSGAAITLIWAALAAVVVWLAASDRDPVWLAGGLTLFGAVLLRLLAFDLQAPDALTRAFIHSGGASGALHPRLLLNPRAYALAGAAVALLVAARACTRLVDGARAATFRRTGFGLLTLGHGALLLLVVTEAHTLMRSTPAAPAAASPDEFRAFLDAYAEAVVAQRERLSMTTTLLLALYAAALVGVGFSRRDRAHRYLGLGLFALTLAKLVFWDVWHLARGYQILILVAVGALLLAASFLYARFGKRLVAILRDGVGPAALLAVTLSGARSLAFEPGSFAERRVIEGVEAPGYYRVEIDPALYRRSKAEAAPLADVRIAGPDGAEVPYLVREVPVQQPALDHPATLVDPVEHPDGATSAVLDLGRAGLKHSEVRVETDNVDFLRRTRVEVSQDERAWSKIAEGAILYHVQSTAQPGRQSLITYPVSDARYLRVTILPGADGRPVRITSARVMYAASSSRPEVRTLEAKVVGRESDPKGKTSFHIFDAGEPGLPISALSFVIDTPTFERRAVVSGTNFRSYWPVLGAGVLYRLAPLSRGGEPAEHTRLDFPPARKRYFKLEVRDGDDSPLHIESAHAEWRAEELVFHATRPGPHLLYVGAAGVPAPSYDLAAVLKRSEEVALLPARFGAIAPNPRFGQTTTPAAPSPTSERYRLPITIALSILLVALALWTVRLLRRAKRPD